jgi:formylglycine-generating enzyme required for sulfatase activity
MSERRIWLCIVAGALSLGACVRGGFDPGHLPVADGGVPDGLQADGSVEAALDLASDLLGDGPAPADVRPDAVDPSLFVLVNAATFTMGSPTGEPCRDSQKETLLQVKLTRAFEVKSTEVTQGQFSALMGYNPSNDKGCGATCPVEGLTWSEAAAYCNALSQKEGYDACYDCTGSRSDLSCQDATAFANEKIYDCPGYRLPTEAEWELAYRAGTQTAYYNGPNDPNVCGDCAPLDAHLDKIGWYCGNSQGSRPVGLKQPNKWGLFDMAGNVAEWCHDLWQSLDTNPAIDPWGGSGGVFRVIRGGSWSDKPFALRAAYRGLYLPLTATGAMIGFRCSRTKK